MVAKCLTLFIFWSDYLFKSFIGSDLFMPINKSWVRDLALVFALLTSPLTDDAQEYVPMSLLGYVTHFQGVVPVFIYKF